MNDIRPENEWFWELTTACQTEAYDLVSFHLFELGASGIEELEDSDSTTILKVFFPSTASDPADLLRMSLAEHDELKTAGLEVRLCEKKPYQNWQESWRDFFKPIEIGSTFIIRPPWESSQAGKKEIVIHPGQGFGTGYHESTNLALQLLEWVLNNHPVQSVSDIGTGSGILAIAALMLSAGHVTAIDLDPEALNEVPSNLVLSGLDTSSVTLIQCGPESLKVQTELVVANIEGHKLKEMADDLMRLTLPGGYLLMSGILTEYESTLMPVFQNRFQMVKSVQLGEWTAVVLQKSKTG